MTRFLQRILMFAMFVLLASCGGGNDSKTPVAPKAKSTLLIYMVASNLVGGPNGANWSINSIVQAKSSPDVNIILQVGGGNQKGSIPAMDMTKTRRYHVSAAKSASGGTVLSPWQIELLPDAQQPKTQAMNDGNALREFIEWGASAYPAEKMHLVMYDHGGGPIDGYGVDFANGDKTTMSVPAIAKALADSKVHFELIGFDACLMANIEVASLLAPYGNYLAATEDLTLFWDWKGIVDLLADSPSATGDQIGKQIVQGYKATMSRYGLQVDYVTTAIIDLRKIPALVSEVGKITSALQQKLDQEGLSAWLKIAAATRYSSNFQTNFFSDYDLVDLLSWTQQLVKVGAITSAQSEALESALHAAVVYTDDDQENDDDEDKSSGLSFYFPRFSLSNNEKINQYLNLGYATELTQLTRSYVQFAGSGAVPQIQVGQPSNSAGQATSLVSSNISSNIQPFDSAYAVLGKGGVLGAMQEIDIQGLELRMAQPNLWPHLDNRVVSLMRMREEADLEAYVIPVWAPSELNPENLDDYRRGLLIAVKNDQGQIVVRGRIEANSIAGGAVAQITLKPGETFYPLRYRPGAVGESNPFYPLPKDLDSPLVAPDGDWVVQMQPLAGAGFNLYTAAIDLKGALKLSPGSIALPLQ